MTLEIVRQALGWCTLIDFGILLCWWFFITMAHDFAYRLHSRWFKVSVEQFDTIHYVLMGCFKLAFFLLHLIPYLALRIVL